MDRLEQGALSKPLYRNQNRSRHSRNYMRTRERLCRLAKNCDVDGIIEDALMQSAFGLLYLRMRKHRPEDEPDSKNRSVNQ